MSSSVVSQPLSPTKAPQNHFFSVLEVVLNNLKAVVARPKVNLKALAREMSYSNDIRPLTLTRAPSSTSSLRSAASSTGTFSLYPRPEEGEEVTVEGVTHTELVLSARKWRTPEFRARILTMFRDELRVKTWENRSDLTPDVLHIHKVAGSLTNAVFFISAPSVDDPPRKFLLRIYGPSSTELISRPKELYTLYKLSSIYRIGPRVYGTFGNGRVEEYFDSAALTEDELRDPTISRWIGRRMSELHCVDIGEVMSPGDGWEDPKAYAIFQNVSQWRKTARTVLEALEKKKLPKNHSWRNVVAAFDIDRFEDEWDAYRKWLREFEAEYGESERVFAHNDAQFGNLLKLTELALNRPSHHRIIVVDFEYAAPNPAAWDIANHFHEWTARYVTESATPWLLDTARYPTIEQRQHFYHAYISPLPTGPSSSSNLLLSSSQTSLSSENFIPALHNRKVQEELDQMERQVRAWSPSSHAMWALWGLVQAKDDVLGESGESGDFNYLGYAVGRVEGFRRELAELGIKTPE